MNKPIHLHYLLATVAAVILAGCGPGERQPETVEERAQARWEAMAAGDFEEAWNYYSPGYRDTTPVEAFAEDMRRRPVRWTGAEVLGAECDGDRCKVSARVSYRIPSGPTGIEDMEPSRHVNETWIRTRDQWWYAP